MYKWMVFFFVESNHFSHCCCCCFYFHLHSFVIFTFCIWRRRWWWWFSWSLKNGRIRFFFLPALHKHYISKQFFFLVEFGLGWLYTFNWRQTTKTTRTKKKFKFISNSGESQTHTQTQIQSLVLFSFIHSFILSSKYISWLVGCWRIFFFFSKNLFRFQFLLIYQPSSFCSFILKKNFSNDDDAEDRFFSLTFTLYFFFISLI